MLGLIDGENDDMIEGETLGLIDVEGLTD